jgi:hypothetical protein
MYLDKRQFFARYCPVRQAYRDFRVMCLGKQSFSPVIVTVRLAYWNLAMSPRGNFICSA